MRKNAGIIDSHVHISGTGSFEFLSNYLQNYGLSKINVVSIACTESRDVMQNISSALIKHMHPENVYCYGSLAYPFFPLTHEIPAEYNLVGQVKRLMDIGFDGIKMLEGKPTVRKLIGIPLDSPVYDDYYAYLEEQKIPVVFHAADPETFWRRETAPEFSFENSWFYGDGTFPEKETIHREIDGILTKFPGLRITFAHFYFLSDDIDRAEAFLDRWKNVSFDITPGREMYENFSKSPGRWKSFFNKYRDRIVFGTDMEDSMFQGSPEEILSTMRRFLETGDSFDYWGFRINGLALDEDVTAKIYHGNFESYAGKHPRKINTGLLLDECARLEKIASGDPEARKLLQDISMVIDMIKEETRKKL